MADQAADASARGRQGGFEQGSGTAVAEVMRHAQDMTNDVLQHVPRAAGDVARQAQGLGSEVAAHSRTAAEDVLRETPILMGHLKENILGWFRPKEHGGHGNHPHR